MRISKDGKTVLIENPLTGNSGFAQAMGLEPVKGIPQWATPDVARTAIGDDWRKATKVVLVRDPEARFASGATLARITGISDDNPEPFNEWLAGVETDSNITSGAQWARALLEHMQGGGEVPTYLHPQTAWLQAHFNLVLATHDLASYFNYEVKDRCCQRLARVASLPANREVRVHLGAEHDVRALLLEVYSDDVELFSRLRVWWHDSKVVRQVAGICVLCSNPASKVDVLDLTAPPEEDLHASANVAPSKHASKRKRKTVDNTGAGE